MVCGGPPATSILRSFPPEKNARYRLSGDQNGRVAPSVPGRRAASSELIERTQMLVVPEESVALNASWRPSWATSEGAFARLMMRMS